MDWTHWIDLLGTVVQGRTELLLGVHLAILGTLVAAEAGTLLEPFRRAPRGQFLGLGGLVAGAWVIRAWVIPALSRHLFDGHEADYFDVWRHASPPPDFAYRTSLALRVLYRWLGPVFDGSGWWLVTLHLLVSLLLVPMVWSWVGDLVEDPEAGLWAAAIIALDPVVGFWASSAYNVLLPFVCSVAALASWERGIRRARPLSLMLGTTWWALAVAFRAESVLLLVPLVWRLLKARRLIRARFAWWSAMLLPLGLVAAQFLAGRQGAIGHEGIAYMERMFQRQVLMFDLLTPFSDGPVLLSLALGLGTAWIVRVRHRWVIPFLLVTAATQHLAFAFFDDYGFRHTLIMRLCLAGLAGLGLAAVHQAVQQGTVAPHGSPFRRFAFLPTLTLFLIMAAPLAKGIADVAQRYYASGTDFFQADTRFRTTPDLDPRDHASCAWIAESDCLDLPIRASHFQLFNDIDRQSLAERSGNCILFAYDRENFQASSRSIHARAVKLARFFHLELIGRVVEPERDCYALVFRVGHPRALPW